VRCLLARVQHIAIDCDVVRPELWPRSPQTLSAKRVLTVVNRLEKSPMLFTRETTYQQALEYRETAKRALLNDVVVRHMVSRIRHSIEAAARGSYPRDEAMIDTAYLLLAYAEHVKAAR
jgi:hypothetical protein